MSPADSGEWSSPITSLTRDTNPDTQTQCSHDENFAHLNRPDPGNYAVALANPKSLEYQIIRTSLLPGLLKTARENKALPLPMKIFEVSDVAVQDKKEERQARNFRRLAALYMDRKAGFEVAHGLLDRVMQILGVPFIGSKDNQASYGYYIQAVDGEFGFELPFDTFRPNLAWQALWDTADTK